MAIENFTVVMVPLILGMIAIMKISKNGEIVYAVSQLNGKSYLVRDLPDKQVAVDRLVTIIQRLEKLRDHLAKNKGTFGEFDYAAKRIVENFNPDAVSEGSLDHNYTSYTVNKGEKMVFCLRSRDDHNQEQLHDINTLTFVAIHEMAHIGCRSQGHNEEFKKVFKFLLQYAVNIGIYSPQNYQQSPVRYCGVNITDDVLG